MNSFVQEWPSTFVTVLLRTWKEKHMECLFSLREKTLHRVWNRFSIFSYDCSSLLKGAAVHHLLHLQHVFRSATVMDSFNRLSQETWSMCHEKSQYKCADKCSIGALSARHMKERKSATERAGCEHAPSPVGYRVICFYEWQLCKCELGWNKDN